MEKQLKLVFKRDNRNNLTFIYCTDKKINLEKLGIENKLFENEDGWYDCDGELIEDELDIFKKEEGQIDLGDERYYWAIPKNLTFEEFEAYLKNPVWSEIMEILDELKIDKDVYHFLLKKEDYYYFQDLVKKISREIYDGCNLNEILEKILEIIGEEEDEE